MGKDFKPSKQLILRLRNLSTAVVLLSLVSLVGFGKRKSLQIHFQNLRNWGLSNKKADSHIHATDAWKIEQGSKKVIVAVIDTGIDPTHPDLKANLWKGSSGETGFNFVTNRPNPLDDHGHGTHVAGIIGAASNPKVGTSGVAPSVSLMAVKYYSDSNSGLTNLKNTVKAIDWAVQHGANIINYSGGGPEFSEEEFLAIKRAEAQGVLIIAAAGNEKQDIDQPRHFYYPAAYRVSNVISVAALDIDNHLLKTSNWGKLKVDVAAPGENIFSTLPGGKYGYMSGTSQATAFVTGVAALLLSKNPSLNPSQIRQILRQSSDSITGLNLKIASGGRVNAYRALLAVEDRSKNNLTRSIARGPQPNLSL